MWPEEVKELNYFCSADGSHQPALVYSPQNENGSRPLLVALHTWSFGYKQAEGETVYARWCIQNGWHFIHPDFRGGNNTPEAMGSGYVISDITDAVNYMKEHYSVDTQRIYCIGVSGGGHAALLMAGRSPGIWAGVSAWCGISDILEWYKFNIKTSSRYADDIAFSIGGDPSRDLDAEKECRKRSPLTYLGKAESVNLDINAGVKDGREGAVPFSQSLAAFNEVASEDDKIDESDIEAFYNEGIIPPNGSNKITKELYGLHLPIFVKTSANVRVVVFDGGHDIIHLAALNWLAIQRKGRKARWFIEHPVEMEISEQDMKSGL